MLGVLCGLITIFAVETVAVGLVNMKEFQPFAKAWLQQNPDDPSINHDPNYYDPNDYAGWNPACNLDNTGTSQYFIDIADLQVFLEDHWLWQACRLEPSQSAVSGMDTMTENLSLSSDGVAKANTSEANVSTLARVSTKILLEEPMPVEEVPNPYSEMSNSELALFVKDIQELKLMIAEQAKSECEDSEDLTDLMDFFDEILADVQKTLQE